MGKATQTELAYLAAQAWHYVEVQHGTKIYEGIHYRVSVTVEVKPT